MKKIGSSAKHAFSPCPRPVRQAHNQAPSGFHPSSTGRASLPVVSAVSGSGRSLPSDPGPAPHSGYHFDGTDRRFFEGWYFKVTIPEPGFPSFAFIYSVENPVGNGPFSGVGCQVMGPDDGYICQFDRSTRPFWADKTELTLGSTFLRKKTSTAPLPRRAISASDWERSVEQGFQCTRTFNQGAIVDQPEGAACLEELKATVPSCRWNYTVRPVYSWGNASTDQQATAGWLAALPVFEPHWQILMSHGLATGWVEWGDKRYEFTDAPAYAEKNWGGGFPKKWMWIQCNTFDDAPGLCLTTGGGRRALPLLNTEEDVALIGVHYEGKFVEIVPWNGVVEWEVTPWGSWKIKGGNSRYRAEVTAVCEASDGTPLRAPTADQGLAPFCRDTFNGRVHLRVWDLQRSSTLPWIDARSTSAALEVGGGPWWSTWKTRSEMKEPLRTMLTLPIEQATSPLLKMVPKELRPPGI